MGRRRSSKSQRSNKPPSPPPQQVQKKSNQQKHSPSWITPAICGAVITLGLLFSAINGQWHEIWFEYFFIPVAIGVAAFGLYELLTKKTKIRQAWSILLSLFSFVLLSSIIVFIYWLFPSPKNNAFTIVPMEAFADLPNEAPRNASVWYWWSHYREMNGSFQRELNPIGFFWYVRITNNKDVPAAIDDFSVETQMPDGKWHVVPCFDVLEAFPIGFYFVDKDSFDFRHAKGMNFPAGYLQANLKGKSIGPHESVEGWLMLDIPSEGVNYQKFRFRTKTGDLETCQDIEGIAAEKTGMDIATMNGFEAVTIAQTEDLSGIPLKFYSDGANIVITNQ